MIILILLVSLPYLCKVLFTDFELNSKLSIFRIFFDQDCKIENYNPFLGRGKILLSENQYTQTFLSSQLKLSRDDSLVL